MQSMDRDHGHGRFGPVAHPMTTRFVPAITAHIVEA